MAIRGQKPLPTALHRLRGTYNPTRHGRDRAGAAQAEGELGPQAPEWMTPAQREGWAYAVEHAPRGVLMAIDRGVLAVWVEAEDRHRTAMVQQARLDAGASLPLLTKGRDGQPIASPYLRIARQSAEMMLLAASELGFTPTARPRLFAMPQVVDEADDPFTEFVVYPGGKGMAG